jgi:NAD(P)-dependent dehydrogenase (short-subunit alcohol dehydrogenase family)
MNVTRAVLPVMRRQRSGHLFTIASMGGYLGGSRGTAYAASKFAVAGFTESLALELEEFGITATIVGPGYFRTDFLDKSSAILEPATLIEESVPWPRDGHDLTNTVECDADILK